MNPEPPESNDIGSPVKHETEIPTVSAVDPSVVSGVEPPQDTPPPPVHVEPTPPPRWRRFIPQLSSFAIKSLRMIGSIVFGLTALIGMSAVTARDDLGWVNKELHPFWIIVLGSALQGGILGGLAAGLLASGALLWLTLHVQGWPGRWEFFFRWELLDLPIAFILAGAFVGEWITRLREQVAERQGFLNLSTSDRERLAFSNQRLEESNRHLRERLSTQLSPATFLYQVATRLGHLEEEPLTGSALEILTDQIKAEHCAFYRQTGLALIRLESRHAKTSGESRPGQVPEMPLKLPLENGVAAAALRERRLVSLRERFTWDAQQRLPEGEPIMAVPVILSHGEVLGVLAIGGVPFLHLTSATERTVALVADWLAAAVERARIVAELQARAILDRELWIPTEASYFDALQREFSRSRRYGKTFGAYVARIQNFEALPADRQLIAWKVAAHIIGTTLRTTDMAARHAEPGALWLLCAEVGDFHELVGQRIQKAVAEAVPSDTEIPALEMEVTCVTGPGAFGDWKEVVTALGRSRDKTSAT